MTKCPECGKVVQPKMLDPKRWTGHHALCPNYGKKPKAVA
jgi:hypothetical protein